MKLLLTNIHLRYYAGSEINTLQLAQALRGLGHQADAATFYLEDPMRTAFAEAGIPVTDLLKSVPLREDYDLYWCHHAPTLSQLIFKYRIPPRRILFSALGSLEPLEAAPLYHAELPRLLANSAVVAERMVKDGVPPHKIIRFPNFAPRRFFEQAKTAQPEKMQRVAVISNHPPKEIAALPALAAARGIQVDLIGRQNVHVLVEPDVLLPYDAVISIGKTAPYCLALKIPIYCYDVFGGPGYLNVLNFERAADFNFAGRGFDRFLTPADLLDDLARGFQQARDLVDALHTRARERFCLEDNLALLLEQINALPVVDTARIRRQYPLVERGNEIFVREYGRSLPLYQQTAESRDWEGLLDTAGRETRAYAWLLDEVYHSKAFRLGLLARGLRYRLMPSGSGCERVGLALWQPLSRLLQRLHVDLLPPPPELPDLGGDGED